MKPEAQRQNFVFGKKDDGPIALYITVAITPTFNVLQVLEAGTEILFVGWLTPNVVYFFIDQYVRKYGTVSVSVNCSDSYPWQNPGRNALADQYVPSAEFAAELAELRAVLESPLPVFK